MTGAFFVPLSPAAWFFGTITPDFTIAAFIRAIGEIRGSNSLRSEQPYSFAEPSSFAEPTEDTDAGHVGRRGFSMVRGERPRLHQA